MVAAVAAVVAAVAASASASAVAAAVEATVKFFNSITTINHHSNALDVAQSIAFACEQSFLNPSSNLPITPPK